MTDVVVRGGPLHVDDPGDGPPFVWGHGLTSSQANEDAAAVFRWREHLPGWRVVRYDARGHGRSGRGAGQLAYRWDELARDLLALADTIGVERFACGGASMGAATTLHAAVAAPERVTAMVLVVPPTAWETRAGQGEQYRAAADLIERRGMAAYLKAAALRPSPAIFAPLTGLTKPPPDIAEAVMPTVLRGAADSDLPDPDVVRTLSQPTLVLAWDTDPGHPVSTAERLVELLPDGRLEVATRLEHLADWPRIVAGFLGERLP